ncbi:hypothetical protein KXV85_005345, partial [Aspergillus fumigatus]
LRLQGELRRIQADGPRALRQADLRGSHPLGADRPEGRRLLSPQHEILRLYRFGIDDECGIRRSVWRAGAPARKSHHPARNGSRRLDPGRHRRCGAQDCAASARPHGVAEFVHGRRCRPQLRRQRQAAARENLRQYLDPARSGRCRRRAWRGLAWCAQVLRRAASA